MLLIRLLLLLTLLNERTSEQANERASKRTNDRVSKQTNEWVCTKVAQAPNSTSVCIHQSQRFHSSFIWSYVIYTMASLLYVWYKDTTSSACLIFHSSMPLCVFVCFYSHIFIATVKISKQIKPKKKQREKKQQTVCKAVFVSTMMPLIGCRHHIYIHAHETGKPNFILLSLEFWWDNLIHWGIKADRSSVRLLSTLCTYPKLWNRIYHQQQKTLYLNNEQFSAISMGNKIRWCVTNMKQEMKNPFWFFSCSWTFGTM